MVSLEVKCKNPASAEGSVYAARMRIIPGDAWVREGDPLIPSRILFADSAETVARRVIHFYEDPPATIRPALLQGDPDVILEPPEPGRVRNFDQINVTQFRAYLVWRVIELVN